MKTTLKDLRTADACTERYTALRKGLGKNYGDSTPITMTQILDLNGLDDCLWAISHTQNGRGDKLVRLFACDCAERALPIFEKTSPNDTRPRDCIAVARRFANGEATDQERAAAGAAAGAAARDAAGAAARDAARDAAWAAAGAAAWDAAWAAAWAAAWDAAWAAAGAAAWAAAGDAARDAEIQWQTTRLRELLMPTAVSEPYGLDMLPEVQS